MAVSAVIGIEKGIRLLQALGVQFTAQAVGPQPPKKELDEACDEISAALNQHPQTTAAKVGAARGLARRLPTTLARLACGDLSLHQATRIEHALRSLDVTTAQAVEADAVPGSSRRLFHRLETALARHAPDHVRNRDQQRRTRREAYYWSDPADGTAGIGLHGPLELVAQIKAALDSDASHRAADDPRPIGTRRFDVLYDWARATLGLTPAGSEKTGIGPADPLAPRPRRLTPCDGCGYNGTNRIGINVTLSAEAALHLSNTAGDLNGLPISADAARALAADGAWRRWILDSRQQLLDVGAVTYKPGAALARHIRARDQTCRMPGCNRPAIACDLDHTISYRRNGKTIVINLAALCRRHHRIKHETAWTYTMEDDTAVWISPSGRTYTDPPDQLGDDPVLTDHLAKATARRAARAEAAAGQAPKPKPTRHRPGDDPWMALPDADPSDDDLPF
jgi:hypothetical protein